MIPKTIHYCWFGKNKKSKLLLECINSWKQFCPNFQIIEWNEKNTYLSHPFVKEAYKLKKWAFVSDYVRLQVLYTHGGIYLDTDMMVVKPLYALLKHSCFFGAEDVNFVSCGIIGSVKENCLIAGILKKYDEIQLSKDWELIAMPILVTKYVRQKYGFDGAFNQNTDWKDLTIYEPEYFYPLPNNQKKEIRNYKSYFTSKTFAVHLWQASWVVQDEFYYISKKYYCKSFGIILKKTNKKEFWNVKYLKKIAKMLFNSLQKIKYDS